MYSMNRTGISRSLPQRTSGRISLSLIPRCTTVLILTPKPSERARSIPRRTLSTFAPTPFICPNTSLSSASRLTVTRCNPARRNFTAWLSRSTPLVVMARSSTPSRLDSILTNSSSPCRRRGSPPVKRNLRTPRPATRDARCSISS